MAGYFLIIIFVGLAVLAWYLFNTSFSDVHETFERLAERYEGKVQKTAPFTYPQLFIRHAESTLVVTIEKDTTNRKKFTIARYLVPKTLETFQVNGKQVGVMDDDVKKFSDRYTIASNQGTFLDELLNGPVEKAMLSAPADVAPQLFDKLATIGHTQQGKEVMNPCWEFRYNAVIVDERDYVDFIAIAKTIADRTCEIIENQ